MIRVGHGRHNLKRLVEEMEQQKPRIDRSSKRTPVVEAKPSDSTVSIDQLAGTFKAMAYPQRIRILQALSEKGMYFSELSKLTGLKTTALNNNLNILMDAELIMQEHRRGRYLATETGKQMLQTLSAVLSGMSPTAIDYVKQYHNLYRLTRKRRQVLEGVPTLGWGRDIECTFFGALDATLRFLGEPVDYVYLMGVSAAAFRFNFYRPVWCPSSADAALNETYALQALKAIGYKGQLMTKRKVSQEEINQIIREEIGERKPVVAIDLMRGQDWGIVTGYQNGKLLCCSYQGKGEGYSVAEKDPWIILKMEKGGPTSSRTESIRDSLKLAVKLATKDKISVYVNGFAAFDAWVKDLENENLFSEMDEDAFRHHWYVNAWIYASLFDARLAATRYLQRIEDDFSRGEKEAIREAAERFENIKNIMFDNWVYFPYSHAVRKARGTTWAPKRMIDSDMWTEETRKKAAEVLKIIKRKEKEALEVLSRIS
ncbi:MAG: winged helix-turn-helix domain-containing protein [Candidatus Bathyarchaeota archaeon]|nr:winged helix-turn-helix domain-containing protein [Candidatus Bathyarchaeota archaeon]